ncbi:hypothetical protein TRIUR3_24736 [Triticum urartu]|uniref:Uncharacterized protein n=1 Tax=Triticum urartu TaxID=4572 RepID=M8AF55_TRIUA|nr:hypothetical protein TRIUR3_24736 [Triticum urartu]
MRTRAAAAPWRAGHLDEEEAAASVTKPCWWSADDRGTGSPVMRKKQGGGAEPSSNLDGKARRSRGRGGEEKQRTGRTARLWAEAELIGFKEGEPWPDYGQQDWDAEDEEIRRPPTTHFVATIDDLTDMLDFDSEDIDGP